MGVKTNCEFYVKPEEVIEKFKPNSLKKLIMMDTFISKYIIRILIS